MGKSIKYFPFQNFPPKIHFKNFFDDFTDLLIFKYKKGFLSSLCIQKFNEFIKIIIMNKIQKFESHKLLKLNKYKNCFLNTFFDISIP